MNLDALMCGLADIGYDGYFTFEASQMMLPEKLRRPFDKEKRIACAPLELRIKAENLLFEIGKAVLEAYGRFDG